MLAKTTTPPGFDVWGFLLFSHGWTWLWWAVPILAGWHVFAFPGIVFLVIGGTGVLLGGIAMAWLVDGRRGLADLWNRLVDPGLIPLRWTPVLVLLFPALALGAGGLVLATGVGETPIDVAGLVDLVADPVGLIIALTVILLLGPLPEEIGWRGYWLDRLQLRWSALTASLLLGVAWAAWHAPLFVMVGYYDAWEAPPAPAQLAFGILVTSILYTWVYNNVGRSVLAVVVFHVVQNATGELLDLSPEARLFQTVLTVAVVVAIVGYWGPRDLRRGAGRPRPPDAEGWTGQSRPPDAE